MHERPDRLAIHDRLEVARPMQIENNDRKLIVHAQRNRGRIHHLEATLEHLEVRELLEALRSGMSLGVGIVHAVNLGRLENDFGANFHRSESRCGVGSKVRIACPCSEDHDSILFKMPDRAAPDVRLRQLLHIDRRLNARMDLEVLKRILQRKTVEHGCQHSHIVRRGAVHPRRGPFKTTEDVTAPDDDRDLDIHRMDLLDLVRQDF